MKQEGVRQVGEADTARSSWVWTFPKVGFSRGAENTLGVL